MPGMLNFELLTSVPWCTLFGPCNFAGCHCGGCSSAGLLYWTVNLKSNFIYVLTSRDTDQLMCGWNSILGKGVISLLVKGLLSHQSSSVASCHCRLLSFHEWNVSVEGRWCREVVSWSRERVSLVLFMMLFRLYGAWGPSCNSPRSCLTFFCPLSF